MPTTVQLNLVDRSGERTSVRVPVLDMGAGTLVSIEAFRDDFATMLTNLTLLNPTGESINETTRNSYTLPTDENANREMAVRFVMQDANSNQVAFSLGGPNLANFPFTTGEGGDVYAWDPLGVNADLVDFVTTVTLVARHPISGLALTMLRLELVGRNN